MTLTPNDFALIGDWSETGIDVTLILAQDDLGRTLMQLRDDFDHILRPGHWSFFGGHVEPQEPLLPCAVREFEEETGITLQADELTPMCRLLSSQTHRWFVFRCSRIIAPQDVTLGEGAGFGFLTSAQIATYPTVPRVQELWDYWQEQKSCTGMPA